MASVRRKPRSKYWYACYTDGSGVQQQISTKLTKKTEAFQLAVTFERAAHLDLAEAEALAEIGKIFARLRGDNITKVTIKEHLQKWLEERRGEVEAVSLERYRSSIDRFLSSLGSEAHVPVHRCSESHIRKFREERAAEVAPSTVNADINVLRFAFKRAMDKRLIVVDPTEQVQNLAARTKRGSSLRRPYTREEFRHLLEHANTEWEGMLYFGLYTAQRLGDIARVRWRDLENGVMKIIRSKQQSAAVVPLHPVIQAYLQQIPRGRPNDPVFPDIAETVRKTGRTGGLSNQFHKLLVAAGLAAKRSKKNTGRGHDKARTQSELSFHCLRHTANSWLKEAGVGEAVVRDIVGHESTDVSRVYTHIDDATKLAAICKLPFLQKGGQET
ncbi:tyrosine-type recombinase/integrase [Actomonas aquatica]|uniref:Tyrosine-type recombinase/integrase n=1 Tax=Actomonas aquatica TaxID=2866162 RepID=A0ABZ1C2A8_9BACT|nr:tyrosine-type recombinase/integrase [Opitutus sp. WL0086]WRQ85546.1 tyrosine-type recombinase/integrase [Opitutus sp. WL0086]